MESYIVHIIALLLVVALVTLLVLYTPRCTEKYTEPAICIVIEDNEHTHYNDTIKTIISAYAESKGYDLETVRDGSSIQESVSGLIDKQIYDYIFWIGENIIVNNFSKSLSPTSSDFTVLVPGKAFITKGNPGPRSDTDFLHDYSSETDRERLVEEWKSKHPEIFRVIA